MATGRASTVTGAQALAVVAVAIVARITAAIAVAPSDDLLGWRWVEEVLARGGDPYLETPRLNWPPLWMIWIGVAGRIARASPLDFDLIVRALPIAADAIIALVLARRSRLAGFAYALHPVAVFTTGAQAQFDALPTLGLLVAVHLVASRPVDAGLALGIGAGFKTWPVALVPVLAALHRRRERLLPLLSAALAPPALLLAAVAWLSPEGFARHVAGYASYPGWWGLTSLGMLFPGSATVAVAAFVAEQGRLIVIAAMLAVAALAFVRRWPAEWAVRVALLAFLAVTPGFGPQYLLWLLPFALVGGRLAIAWHAVAALLPPFEQLIVPRLPLDPSYTAAEAALLHNEIINWGRLPLWLIGLVWLGQLSRRSATASDPTPVRDRS